MISFTFTVNKSFLQNKYSYRYITVPKSQVDYGVLEEENLAAGRLTVVCPNGEKMSGYMHYGVAGYGPYYQIRIRRGQDDPLGQLALGQCLKIYIQRMGREVQVRLKKLVFF